MFTHTDSPEELQKEYKRLARVYHPDLGGSTVLMQELNREYQLLKHLLNKRAWNPGELKLGDTVFVNGTECRVTFITRYTFIARARDHGRTAVFDKTTGVAVANKKFKARF